MEQQSSSKTVWAVVWHLGTRERVKQRRGVAEFLAQRRGGGQKSWREVGCTVDAPFNSLDEALEALEASRRDGPEGQDDIAVQDTPPDSPSSSKRGSPAPSPEAAAAARNSKKPRGYSRLSTPPAAGAYAAYEQSPGYYAAAAGTPPGAVRNSSFPASQVFEPNPAMGGGRPYEPQQETQQQRLFLERVCDKLMGPPPPPWQQPAAAAACAGSLGNSQGPPFDIAAAAAAAQQNERGFAGSFYPPASAGGGDGGAAGGSMAGSTPLGMPPHSWQGTFTSTGMVGGWGECGPQPRPYWQPQQPQPQQQQQQQGQQGQQVFLQVPEAQQPTPPWRRHDLAQAAAAHAGPLHPHSYRQEPPAAAAASEHGSGGWVASGYHYPPAAAAAGGGGGGFGAAAAAHGSAGQGFAGSSVGGDLQEIPQAGYWAGAAGGAAGGVATRPSLPFQQQPPWRTAPGQAPQQQQQPGWTGAPSMGVPGDTVVVVQPSGQVRYMYQLPPQQQPQVQPGPQGVSPQFSAGPMVM